MIDSSFTLSGKVAIVTGAGSGIGRAIAALFAQAGARVIVAGRRLDACKRVADDFGGTAVACDVTRLDDVERLFQTAMSISGRVDVLVNNAGVSGPVGQMADVDLTAWRECIDVNMFGAMHCLRVAARIMREQRSGSIVNIASFLGLQGYPMRTAYCASKFALIGMTEAVARELGPTGVRVNALCPGAVSGELMDKVISERAAAEGRPPEAIIKESYTDLNALRRWVTAEDVARTALFLASAASAGMTGCRVRVDAGRF